MPICGGGIAGLTITLLPHRQGVDPVLTKKHASTSPHPQAGSTDAPRSSALLGLLGKVEEAAAPFASLTQILTGPLLSDAVPSKLSGTMRGRLAKNARG